MIKCLLAFAGGRRAGGSGAAFSSGDANKFDEVGKQQRTLAVVQVGTRKMSEQCQETYQESQRFTAAETVPVD